MQNHQISVSSATDKTNYFLSFGYFTQDGIVGGNYDRSNYNRMTLRSNITNYLLNDKSRNWLNKIQIGMNASYAHITSKSLETNSEFGSILGSSLTLSPILGVYADDEKAVLDLYKNEPKFTPDRKSVV